MDLTVKEILSLFIALTASILEISIFIEVISSWIGNSMEKGRIRLFVEDVNRPFLGLIRRFVHPMGGIDFSPLVGILILEFGVGFLIRLIGVDYQMLLEKFNL